MPKIPDSPLGIQLILHYHPDGRVVSVLAFHIGWTRVRVRVIPLLLFEVSRHILLFLLEVSLQILRF